MCWSSCESSIRLLPDPKPESTGGCVDGGVALWVGRRQGEGCRRREQRRRRRSARTERRGPVPVVCRPVLALALASVLLLPPELHGEAASRAAFAAAPPRIVAALLCRPRSLLQRHRGAPPRHFRRLQFRDHSAALLRLASTFESTRAQPAVNSSRAERLRTDRFDIIWRRLVYLVDPVAIQEVGVTAPPVKRKSPGIVIGIIISWNVDRHAGRRL